MTNELLERCKLFASNLEMMKKNFRWESSQLYAICANIYTDEGIELNPKRIKATKEIIKCSTNMFSNFRSVSITVPLATLLSMDKFPSKTFEQVRLVYDILKELFSPSAYLTLAAYLIVKNSNLEEYHKLAKRSRLTFDMIKKSHFFLTSSVNCITAVIFALSNSNETEIIAKADECFEILKQKLSGGNTIQAISNTLALSEDDSFGLCIKTMRIIEGLRSHGYKLNSGVDLAVFAGLAISNASVEIIIKDILEVNAYLMTVSGFGNIITGSKIMDPKLLGKRRILYSSLIVLDEYSKSSTIDSSLGAASFMASINIINSLSPTNL